MTKLFDLNSEPFLLSDKGHGKKFVQLALAFDQSYKVHTQQTIIVGFSILWTITNLITYTANNCRSASILYRRKTKLLV